MYIPVRVAVAKNEQLSSHFRRITFAGEQLHHLKFPNPVYDLRVKLIFPVGTPGELDAKLPDFACDVPWFSQWQQLDPATRGVMRTYSIRSFEAGLSEDRPTQVVIDFVRHLESGPASSWAEVAHPGSEILLVAPNEGNADGGVEFSPSTADTVLLAGDETAAPAIARILEDLHGTDKTGHAFIEVPSTDDRLPIEVPAGFQLHWLPRNGTAHGVLLLNAVATHLGVTSSGITEDSGTEIFWETPTFSALGEDLAASVDVSAWTDVFFWIAGESSVVKALRRLLVTSLGVPRSKVAFMGYWRKGVAG